ncbi:MAG: murein biosynthesis integral membrane protein MurJ [Candidatus Nealsonbacteria bacterium]|nr:murein biosynthesis integral membrane protein MurJ [Candidatus Nealsonbacteria bacterium]
MKIHRIFNSQTRTVHHAAGILIISALLSRVLGIARDWLLAKNLGAGPDLDIYFAVFRIPDFLYHVIISGGIVVAFLPIFADFFSKDKEEAWKFASNALNIFLLFLVVLSLALFIFAPVMVKLITPGFTSAQLDQTILLTRIMLLSPIFFGLSSIFSGILQYFHRFLVYSFAPILYNFGIILGILFLFPSFGVRGIIYGVLFGAFMHFMIQLPAAISCGFKYKPIFNLGGKGIKQVLILMIPRTLGVAGSQINLMVMTSIASTLAAGSISIFNLAQNLQNIPIGIIGVSFAVAVFAPLSRNFAEGAKGEFLKNFSSTFRQVIYMIFPFSFLIFILRSQIVEIILKHGEFSHASAQLASASLGLFCLGIWAISLSPLLSRAFFAFKDTRTTAAAVFFTVTLNIILSFYFIKVLNSEGFLYDTLGNAFRLEGIKDLRVLGLPLAFAISGIFQFALLMFFLYKKIGDFHLRDIWNSTYKIILSSFVGSAAVYSSSYLISLFFEKESLWAVYLEAVIGSLAGISVYFFTTHLLKSPEAKAIKSRVVARLIRSKTVWRE